MALTVGELLADAAAVAPSGVAATLESESLTYSELDAAANRLALSIAKAGVGRGSVVAWWCGPALETIIGFAAVARLGAVFAPLNPALSPPEAEAALAYLRPVLLVVDEDRQPPSTYVPVRVLEQLFSAPAPDRPLELPRGPLPQEPHIVYLTSGTTGQPKGVVVSHRASWLRAFPGGSTFAAGLRGPGGILASFPLFHYGGFHYVLEAWHHRRAFHLCRRFDGSSLVEAAERWQPSAMYCIPAVWRRVLEASPAGTELSSVRHADTGTSAAPLELLLRLRERMPDATTSVHYGSSEGGHHSTLHDRDVLAKPGSVGQVAPPGVIRLGEDGEIWYRGPTVMDGYYQLPNETTDVLVDGWYRTGDLGVVDGDGYLYVTGRRRELIRTGGESVAPPEVEAALDGLPGVAELAVIGLPDNEWGEVVCAAVVMADPEAPPPEVTGMRAYLGDRLSAFKQPRRIVAVAAIPRTPATGQVQRTLLRELVLAGTREDVRKKNEPGQDGWDS